MSPDPISLVKKAVSLLPGCSQKPMDKSELERYRRPDDFDRYQKDVVFFEDHRDEYIRHHPDEFVAIYKKRKIGSAKILDDLIEQLERRQLDPGQVFIARVTPTEEREEVHKLLRSLRPRSLK